MATVYIGAGLANRMFQYAFALYLKNKGLNVDLDEHTFKPRFDFEDTMLKNVFTGITLGESNPSVLKLSLVEGKFWTRYKKISEYLFDYRYIQRWTLDYYPSIYLKATKHCKFVGYWITYKYFKGIEDDIRKAFIFKPFANLKNEEIAKKLQATNSVAVHFRKNIDYLKHHDSECTPEYYKRAFEVIKKKVDNPKFYFFSDNWDWVRENIQGIEYTPVDWNSPSGPDSYCDMQLMSLCKHNIIANSTYSWWGAWLNNNPQKVVVSPDFWFPFLEDINTIVPSEWSILESR